MKELAVLVLSCFGLHFGDNRRPVRTDSAFRITEDI